MLSLPRLTWCWLPELWSSYLLEYKFLPKHPLTLQHIYFDQSNCGILFFWKKAYQVQSFRSLSFLPCFFFKGLFFHVMYVHHVCRLHQFLPDPPYLPFYPTSSSVSITLTVSVFPRLKWKGTKPMNKNKIYRIKINNFVRQKTNNKKNH